MRDITGQKFNRLTGIKLIETKNKRSYWLFKCDCGNEKVIMMTNVIYRTSTTRSCGCFKKEFLKAIDYQTTHGMKKTRFYDIWQGMKKRCTRVKNKDYKHYGGRGIKCLWKSFEEFRDDMYTDYLEHKKNNNYTSIERKNNDGNYEKSNCSWATREEQQNNRRVHGS